MSKLQLTSDVVIGARACGFIFDDPRFPDGVHVFTSPVVDCDDQFFTTVSGTRYEVIPDESE